MNALRPSLALGENDMQGSLYTILFHSLLSGFDLSRNIGWSCFPTRRKELWKNPGGSKRTRWSFIILWCAYFEGCFVSLLRPSRYLNQATMSLPRILLGAEGISSCLKFTSSNSLLMSQNHNRLVRSPHLQQYSKNEYPYKSRPRSPPIPPNLPLSLPFHSISSGHFESSSGHQCSLINASLLSSLFTFSPLYQHDSGLT